MESIKEYMKQIEYYILKYNGDVSLVEEYRSHLDAEFQEFLIYSNKSMKDSSELEKKFISTLEDPELIANSLLPEKSLTGTNKIGKISSPYNWKRNILTLEEIVNYYFVYLAIIFTYSVLNFLHEFLFPENFIVSYEFQGSSMEYTNSGYIIAVTILVSSFLVFIVIPFIKTFQSWKEVEFLIQDYKTKFFLTKLAIFLPVSIIASMMNLSISGYFFSLSIRSHQFPLHAQNFIFWTVILAISLLIYKYRKAIFQVFNFILYNLSLKHPS